MSNRKFFKGSVITIVNNIILMVVSLMTSVIIARNLGPEGRGIYSLTLLLPTLIFSFSNCGVGVAIVYFIGRRECSLEEILSCSITLSLFLGAFSTLIGLATIPFLTKSILSGVPPLYIFCLLATVPIQLFCGYANNILLGTKRITQYNLTLLFEKLFFLALLLLFFMVLKLDVLEAVGSKVVVCLFVALLLFGLNKRLVKNLSIRLYMPCIKKLLKFGVQSHLGQIFVFLNYRFDMFILNAFLNPLAVGYYAIAAGLTERLWLISMSLSTVLLPEISSAQSDKELTLLTPIVTRITLFLTSLAALIIFIFSKQIVLILYSDKFLQSVQPMRILLLGTVALSISRVLAVDITGRGKPLINSYLSAITAVITIILNVIFIPRIGLIGAAWASTIAYVLQMIGRIVAYNRLSGNKTIQIFLLRRSDLLYIWKFCKSFGMN